MSHPLMRAAIVWPLSPCHTPDAVADIGGDQERAVRAERNADRAAVGDALVGRQEARQDVARRTRRPAVLERDEHDLVARELAASPGAVLADRHALGEAGQGAGREPAQAQRSGMAAERIVA